MTAPADKPPGRNTIKPGEVRSPNGRRGNPVPPDPEGGVVTAARMRKVLGQGKASDAGPTEKELRRWLDKDPKGYSEAIDRKARLEGESAEKDAELVRLRAETADLRKRLAEREPAGPGDDPGADAALGLVEKLLREAAGGE